MMFLRYQIKGSGNERELHNATLVAAWRPCPRHRSRPHIGTHRARAERASLARQPIRNEQYMRYTDIFTGTFLKLWYETASDGLSKTSF